MRRVLEDDVPRAEVGPRGEGHLHQQVPQTVDGLVEPHRLVRHPFGVVVVEVGVVEERLGHRHQERADGGEGNVAHVVGAGVSRGPNENRRRHQH